jgi:flagellar motor switch protein FliG
VRLLEVSTVNREILDDIERALRNDLGMDLVQDKKKDPHNYMADLIGRVNSDTETRLLGSLESISPEHAAMVRKHMFTFADLVRISATSIQALLQECDKSRLAMALKLSDESQRQKFLSNMSERQAKMFREELESGGTPRKPEVEEAQKEIVLLAKALSAAGLLSLEPEDPPADVMPDAPPAEEAPPAEAAAA